MKKKFLLDRNLIQYAIRKPVKEKSKDFILEAFQ
jgi:hypothetical protein